MGDAAHSDDSDAGSPASLRRLFLPLFALAIGLNLLAIWTVDILPLGDYGAHLEQMDIMARYGDPSTVYADVYELPDRINHPNSVSLIAGRLFGRALGTELVGKLLLSFYVIGFPLGLLAICRAFGRNRWLAFFALPLTFNAFFNLGFLNFLIALPLLLLSIATARRFAELGGRRRGLLLMVLLGLTFYAHVMVYLIALGITLALITLFVARLRNVLRLLIVLPSTALFAAWAHRMIVAPQGTETGRQFAEAGDLGATYDPLWERLLELPHHWGMRFFRDSTDNTAALLLLVAWLTLLVSVWWHRRATSSASDKSRARAKTPIGRSNPIKWLRRYCLETITLCCLIAYLVLPTDLSEVEIVAPRVALLTLTLASALPLVASRSRLSTAALTLIVIVALVYPVAVRAKFALFQATEVGALRSAIAELPDGSRMAYFKWLPHNWITHMGPSWHIPKMLHAVENGGWTNDSFAIRPSSPIQFRAGMTPRKLSSRFELDPRLLSYDAVLVRTVQEPSRLLNQSPLSLRYHEGFWWLFDVVAEHLPTDVDAIDGRSGGHDVFWDCPQGQVVTGLWGRSGEDGLTNLAVSCRRLQHVTPSGPETLGAHLVRLRDDELADDAEFDLSCHHDQVVLGLYATHRRYISSLGLVCGRPSSTASESDRDLTRSDSGGREGHHDFEIVCPPNTVAIGFRGRAGLLVDSIGLTCRELSNF